MFFQNNNTEQILFKLFKTGISSQHDQQTVQITVCDYQSSAVQ